jgi:hypothetical protein
MATGEPRFSSTRASLPRAAVGTAGPRSPDTVVEASRWELRCRRLAPAARRSDSTRGVDQIVHFLPAGPVVEG